MTLTRTMITLLDRDFLFKLILALLAYSLVPLGEIFLFVYIGSLIGNYLVLICAAVVGVVGAIAGLGQVRRTASELRTLLARGSYAGPQLADMAGLMAAAILLVTPGFLTDIAGLLLLVPSLRARAGRRFAALVKRQHREVYDRLRLSALESSPPLRNVTSA
jgi:UPF0716 protein FxsA